jgi:hypothetical protein
MKIRTVLMVTLAAVFALPALACGPMISGGTSNINTGTGRTVSPERDHWARRRIKQLRAEMDAHRKADQTARTLDHILGVADNNAGRALFPEGASAAAQRRYMINRYEFLALKAELGKANAKDIAELRALQAALLTPYPSR